MYKKASDVVGLKVVTIQKGKNIDDVDDIIYDPKEQKVTALLVDKGGMFADAKVVRIEDVKSIGKDAVVIESADVIRSAKDVESRVSSIAKGKNYLTKTKIMTEDGTELGQVTDIYFDDATGQVTELEVSEGGLKTIQSGKKRVKVADIITVGEDATIVRDYVHSEFEQQAEHQGLQGAMNTTAEKTKAAAVVTTDKASALKAQATDPDNQAIAHDKASETKEAMNNKTDELAAEAKIQAEKVKHNPQVQTTVQDLKETVLDVGAAIKQGTATVVDKSQEKAADVEAKHELSKQLDVVGKHATKTVLLPNDVVLVQEGELITNQIYQQAKMAGLEDELSTYSQSVNKQ